jgi:tetrahydromethanopterin S-methyltransferase subunit D
MSLSQSTMEHLELILGAALIAAAIMITVVMVVGAMTYLIFREPARAAVPSAEPVSADRKSTPAGREREAHEVPTAVAG